MEFSHQMGIYIRLEITKHCNLYAWIYFWKFWKMNENNNNAFDEMNTHRIVQYLVLSTVSYGIQLERKINPFLSTL